MLRRCKVCGRIFTANHIGEKYCSAKCHGGKRPCSPDISRNFFEDEEERRKKHKSTLAQEFMEARKHGMTYGQWKAQKYMKEFEALERYKRNEKNTK